jgi:hypothetical protein
MTTKLPAEFRIGEEHKAPKTALEIVENFEILVGRERLVRGTYMAQPGVLADWLGAENDFELQEAGALCGGARACALGTLHLATGHRWNAWPGSGEFNAMARDLGTPLGQAMTALDEAAVAYAEEHGLSHHVADDPVSEYATHPLEELFENPGVAELETLPETPEVIKNEHSAMSGVMLEVARRAKELLA